MTKMICKIIMPKRHEIKVRKITPASSLTRVEKDKTKAIPRRAKYKNIEE
jgi:hypothetical protein